MTASEQTTENKVFTDIHEFVKEMAEVTNGIVSVQLGLTGETNKNIIATDLWCLGYVMGFTDGIIQWHKLDHYQEGMLLCGLTFNKIFYGYALLADDEGNTYDGMKYVKQAIESQTNAIYSIGTQKGLNDYIGMMQKTKSPMGLSEYLITKRHQQKKTPTSIISKFMGMFR